MDLLGMVETCIVNAENLHYGYVKAGMNPASELAKLRHADNYAMIDEALDYWRKNIDPKLSAAKAANQLLEIVPLSHKKLAEVVSAEKKKGI